MRRVMGLALGACAALVLLGSQATGASAEVGGAYSWGRNLGGELGNGTTTDSFAATPISLTSAISVVGRNEGGAALLLDGSVMTWGTNESGELGDGTTEASSTPVPVSGLSEVVAIAAKGRFCLALLGNGTVMAWGTNGLGQLGDGTTEKKVLPVPVSGLEHVTAISAGWLHSLALLNNGEVMAWGSNAEGELGNGTKESSKVPVPVPGLGEVHAISAGFAHSLALSGEGTVWAWGSNTSGQLGNGGTSESDVPIAVPGLSSGFVAIAAGNQYGLALRESGTIMSWGSDAFGQLGDGTHGKAADKTSPVNVQGITEATAISGGAFQSMARLANGTAMAWGGNEIGELGIGSAEGTGDVPVIVCGLHEVGGVAAGQLANYAFNVGSASQLCPFVLGVAPTTGGKQGGDAVTVTGGNLVATTAVKFGANTSPKFTVNSSTSLTAVSPPGTGEVEITVVNPEGQSGPSPSPPFPLHKFRYVNPPNVTSVSPNRGPASGGTTVKIFGSGFENVTAVKFGSVPATSFEVEARTGHAPVVKAVSPVQPAGTVDITVTARYGTSLVNTHDRYKVLPVVSSVTPNSGSHVGGTSVTVTGAGFLPGKTATTFRFATTLSKSVNCTSTTECTVISPAHAAGAVDVVATANNVAGAKTPPTDQFTYE